MTDAEAEAAWISNWIYWREGAEDVESSAQKATYHLEAKWNSYPASAFRGRWAF